MRQRYRSVEALVKDFDGEFRQGLIDASRVVVDRQAKRLNDVVKTWKNKIVFRRRQVTRRGDTYQQIVAEGDEHALQVFTWVDEGTEPHRIEPKEAGGVLVFNTPYQARTAPIANPSAGSGRSGDTVVYSRGVDHPGTEARLFIEYSMLESEIEFEQRVTELLNRLAN